MDRMPEKIRLILLAALPHEAGWIVRRHRLQPLADPSVGGRAYRGGDLIVLISGPGQPRSAELAKWALDTWQVDRLIITGFAGSLDGARAVGQIIEPRAIVRAADGRSIECPTGRGGRLLTCDEAVTTVEARQSIAQEFNAHAVDMESFAAAEICTLRRIDWHCVRAISDPADRDLPPGVMNLIDADGRSRPSAMAGWLIRHPLRLPDLVQMGRASKSAARALAQHLAPDLTAAAGR
jgi:hypothetical protein